MKIENWILIALIIAAAFFLPFRYKVELTEITQQENVISRTNVLSSCNSAMAAVDQKASEVFGTEEIRTTALEEFFKTFDDCYNFHSEAAMESAKFYVPCLFLVDWDGYYVSYTQWYKNRDNATMYKEILTSKNTWNKNYGNYMVRYRLDHYVTVTSKTDSTKLKGRFDEIYEKMGQPSDLSFMADQDTFEIERTETIISQINDQVSYYINAQNDFFNKKSMQYTIVLPESDNDHTQELMDKPNVIAFMQGKQKDAQGVYANIYSFIASDVADEKKYYVEQDETDGKLYYHEQDCPDVTDKRFLGTMFECAERKANPADCVK